MTKKLFPSKLNRQIFPALALASALFLNGCASVETAKPADKTAGEKNSTAQTGKAAENAAESSPAKNRITIEKDSPADTVRSFYADLRAGDFREALSLTNLRPAIEGLTDEELKDLQVDFANLSKQIPADIEINGEITSGDEATVTARLPDNETDKIELQEIKLRRGNAAKEAGNAWTILTLDETAERAARRAGKNYLFNLRIETHEREARKMFDRISKAQMVFIAQNNGQYGDLSALVGAGLLPDDALSAESTGYNYKIAVGAGGKSYAATAEPAVYGKTGRLSFGYTVVGGGTSALKSEDRRGQPVKNLKI